MLLIRSNENVVVEWIRWSLQAQSRFGSAMTKAVDFLVRQLPSLSDPYALAVVTYALHLAENPSRDTAFDMLQAAANDTGEFKSWAKPRSERDRSNPWSGQTQSVDVEMTAYALLTYLQRGLVTEALPVMRWMVAQRNSNGGFASTQVRQRRHLRVNTVEEKPRGLVSYWPESIQSIYTVYINTVYWLSQYSREEASRLSFLLALMFGC